MHIYILYFIKVKKLKQSSLDQNIIIKELNTLYNTLRFKIKLLK